MTNAALILQKAFGFVWQFGERALYGRRRSVECFFNDVSVFYVEHRDPKTDAIIPQVDPRTGAVYQTQSMYWGDTYTLYLPQLSNPAVKSEESR